MDKDPQYEQTRIEFAEEWSRCEIEDLLQTNDYERARAERLLYERFLPKEDWILEAGCGLGPKVLHFRKNGFRVIGVDFVETALHRLKAYAPELPLACCDVHECPFPDNSFGAYLSYGVVEHFPKGPQLAIREAHRLLKPGGVILMMVPADNALSRFIHDPDNALNRLRRNSLIRRLMGKPPLGENHEHDLYMKLHTRTEMRGILKDAGFEIRVEAPVSHSFSLFMLCECFQKNALGETNTAAETLGRWMKRLAPWATANHLLFVGKK
ncbi:MAG: class I SAM-dependent methyltransferase [Candidatus Nitrohelix vancouverensis]|uniref:Class I SAM-dependent methyltransferase n=1 Tax=Candidatus Nitrohelix vancouverensis TaxID=2705534 RepID=A0A7T0C1U5_9BACT|nr:MAG: class I SAM-dependent methyltransferase [Candidatus Nitrohelix vancouverensis]